MPTPFVGLHLALAVVVALIGLPSILDPCGGGGDFCIFWIVGVAAFAAAGLVLIGLGVRRVTKRASPLLILDSLLAAVAWSIVGLGPDVRDPLFLVGALVAFVLAAFGAVASGRAVVTHGVETVVCVLALVGVAVFANVQPVEMIVTGLTALGIGWVLARGAAPAEPAATDAPAG